MTYDRDDEPRLRADAYGRYQPREEPTMTTYICTATMDFEETDAEQAEALFIQAVRNGDADIEVTAATDDDPDAVWSRLSQADKARWIEAMYPEPIEMPDFDRPDWIYEVTNGDTDLGYAEWLAHRQEADRS